MITVRLLYFKVDFKDPTAGGGGGASCLQEVEQLEKLNTGRDLGMLEEACIYAKKYLNSISGRRYSK